jgi:calpain
MAATFRINGRDAVHPSSAVELEAGDCGSRYTAGWGSRRTVDPNVSSLNLGGKTYDELKAQCLKERRLFEDPDFPAVDSSIFFSRSPPRPFVWKRPTELSGDAQFFVGGASRFDVKQGELGDCWLLAAVSCLSQFENLLYKVVPPNQGFTSDDGYAGIFRFNFWCYGKWVEVVIDDRLPTYNGRLVFMHSEQKNEFWTPLLEKAYAKLNGSYENLKGGSTSEAMEDFTGGVTEMFDLRQNPPPNLFQIMTKAHERNSLMGCSIDADPSQLEAQLPNGLIMGHAYSITGVKLVDIQTSRMKGKIPLVRVRNPWGNECEWKGAWSDKSQEWKLIPDTDRQKMGLIFSDDGEFWMSFQDFSKNFQKLEICNLGPESLNEESSAKKCWEATANEGCWKKRVNAGGCRNYLETFWTNPQYRICVTDPDEDDAENMGTVIVALMQKERRKKRKEGLDVLTIGYAVYKLKDPNCGPLDINFFKYNASVCKSPAFINTREVCGRHKLSPGTYCVVPSTFEPSQEGDFLLRMYAEKAVTSKEIDEQTSMQAVKPVTQPAAQDTVAEKEMRDAFKKISGPDLEIDAYELQDILNAAFKKEFKFDGFTADTCRSLVAMKDVDRSGKLGYDEFKKLWSDLRLWKTAFKNQDKDMSGNFNSFELRQTLHDIGISISNSTFNSLVQRYSHRDGKIYFDDYIHCIARLCTMFDIFKEMSRGSDKAQFSLDEFISTTMYS